MGLFLESPGAPHTTRMAKAASKCLFLFFLSFLCSSSSGTLVGFSYHASANTTTTSPIRTISFLKKNKIAPSQIRVFVEDHRILRTLSNFGVAVDLYLNEGQVQNIINSKSASISGLKSYIMPFLSQVKMKSIIATSGDYTRKYALSKLLSTLKSIHSVLSSFPADRGIKVSVAFPLSYLENVRTSHGRDLHRICEYIKQVNSAVIVEANIEEELSMGERFVHSMIERASLANSLFPCNDVPMVMTFKSPAVPSATEVAAFANKVSKALENNTHITSSMVGLYAQVSSMEDFAEKEMKRAEEQLFPSSHRELSRNFHLKTTLHEGDDSPTIFPTTPVSTTPLESTTPYIPTPTVVTVPSTNPVTIAPINPLPSTTPITVPSTNPVNSPIPEANPTTAPPITVPGSPVITNPVTTYPAPAGVVPVTTPVTNPVAPPATSTNAPAVPGQSWCVAKTGASETAVQAGLDYACGKVDCSQLQQGGSCYSPVTLQNHASYAFNSYYQKNPVPTSCDFGGVATIVATNPSTGSCTYLASSSSSSSSTTTPTPTTPPTPATPSPPVTTTPTPTPTPESTTPLPANTTPAAPTFPSFPPPGEGVSGSVTPPSVLNSSNPASGTMPPFGIDSPPGFNTSTSSSASLRPVVIYLFLVTALVTRRIIFNM